LSIQEVSGTPGKLDRYLNLINGQRVSAVDGEWLESVDPAVGRPWAEIPLSDEEDVDAAVAAAKRAFSGPWSQLPAAGRGALLRRLAELVTENAERLALIETRDNGRILSETKNADIPGIVQMLHYYAGAADKLHGETVEIGPNSFNYVRHKPLGVAGLILPWNAPLAVMTGKTGAALAAGCTVVVKPPEAASCSILAYADLFAEAGFPDGVVNVVAGLGQVVGDAIAGHPDIARISLTGSTATARAITRRSADAIKPLDFELGGKSANIVFADADLDAAAIGATTASIYTGGAGQVCIAGSRVLVQRSIHDAFVEKMIAASRDIRLGNPLDEMTQMGPIAYDRQFEKVCSYLDIAKKEGAECVMGGRTGAAVIGEDSPFREGYWIEPTLYTKVENSMRIAREEIFGPVACVIPFDDDEEAIAIANDSDYGLACGVWTNQLKRAHRIADGVAVGAVWINAYRRMHWAVPFGGVKDSGYGRGGGMEGIYGYTYSKGVWVDLA